MPQATFASPFADFSIDEESGIIRGVRVMEQGKTASFKSSDGTKKTITLDARHIQALLRQAGNRAIPVHWTHGHTEGKADGLASKVGKLSRFIVGDDGHLRADLHLAPGSFRDTAMWHAKEDPENMMLSAVYSYDAEDEDCIPKDFQAADLVENGAGVTALLADAAQVDAASIIPTNYTMLSPEDLESIGKLMDQKIVEYAASVAPPPAEVPPEVPPTDAPPTDEPAPTDEDAAAMEEEAGVTDEDKKEDDDKKPAALRAWLRCSRASTRQLKAALAKFESAKGEIAIKAEASATAALGVTTVAKPNLAAEKSAKLATLCNAPTGMLPRAEFAALPAWKKSEFCRLGGKIND